MSQANLQLTDEQLEALKLMHSGQNVFLTGPAGSGKSLIVKEFCKTIDKKTFPVLASTGAAAVLIGGRTFHSFFGLGIMEGGLEATVKRALANRRVVSRLKKVTGVIIDEVSMLSSETLMAAEIICCQAREESLTPWGGLQVIAVGDFAQLPPVEARTRVKKWAFSSSVWERSNFQLVNLSKILRTSDVTYLKILKSVRMGLVTKDVLKFLGDHSDKEIPADNVTRLFPRRAQADNYNLSKLSELDTEKFIFKSIYFGPASYVNRLKQQAPVPDQLFLKKGCLVMLRQNDPKQRWVNGSTGILLDVNDDGLLIELLQNRRIVSVEKSTFSLLNADGAEVAAVTNYPVNLAYGTTIHKAQGMTLDQVVVNLKALWEPGQAYVALSRAKSPEGLYIEDWDEESIFVDSKVQEYYESF